MALNHAPVAAVIIMAAGEGKRMRSSKPKVLHTLAGRSMIAHAVTVASALTPEKLVVVLGHQREIIAGHLADVAPEITIAVQDQPLGTGDAVRSGLIPLGELYGEVVVTSGDVPLLSAETLQDLVSIHREGGNTATVLTTVVPDPTGYGRVIRDGDLVLRIVEQRDATDEEQAISEINSGIYVFDATALRAAISGLTAQNDQGELYLTDAVALINAAGGRVGAALLGDYEQLEGVNDREQLAIRNAELNRRILRKWMLAGVTIADPSSTWVHADVELAQDVTLLPGTSLEGATTVATGAVIGPDTTLIDVEVGEGAKVVRSHALLAIIEAEANVGPFSFLRPGTVVGVGGKVGAFVETKNAQIGAGSKVPHLTYCGDAVIGEGVNIGAGTIFANYDGVGKYQVKVGDQSFVGSDSVL
ncbi:MAG: bifunctional UDP-N-acetylglucosamine diphosphorylase/glucosamine-1-phosphate N-acetyltransferase GlmU, partial [Propionibacteriaceae bacterium]|nr:bifunctional UDP-N-acetylglucosamine diphosphorylase/glucosamine-1-phosphate N-acetyltransferase GlmU [Propionibacteriaceae bacterium]